VAMLRRYDAASIQGQLSMNAAGRSKWPLLRLLTEEGKRAGGGRKSRASEQ
jgi:hypothetical protein